MLLRIIIQSWRHNLRRKFLAVLTVFLAAALISALMVISIDSGDKMARELKSFGANLVIEPAGEAVLPEVFGKSGGARLGESFIAESDLPKIKNIFWRNNILGFAPLLNGSARVGGEETALVGTFFDREVKMSDEPGYRTGQQAVSSYWKVTGEWPADDAPQALVGWRLARDRKWRPGNRLELEGPGGREEITLTGILETGGPEDAQLVLPLDRVQHLLGQPGRVQAVRVSALTVPENRLSRRARIDPDALAAQEYDKWYCTAYVSTIAHQLEEALPGTVARPIWQVAASEGAIVEKIQLLLGVSTLAALVSAAMGVASLMTSTIMERSREIGLMKALAAKPWQIHVVFYAEAAISALLGGVLGCLAGWALSRVIGWTLFGAPLSFAWIVVPATLAASLVIAMLGTWFPARFITRLQPAEVLYGRH